MSQLPPKSTSDTSCSPPANSDKPLLDLPTAFSSLTCLQRGLCPVPSKRDPQLESHSIYYEVHGSPATAAAIAPHASDDEVKVNVSTASGKSESPEKVKNKIVFIAGLNASCFYWNSQVRWFASGVPDEEGEEYTTLVFDNRGVGNSGYPKGPYTWVFFWRWSTGLWFIDNVLSI